MANLSVRLFGGFEVRRGAGPSIVIPTRKARALLALLARHPGKSHPRETLATMFWPDHGEPEARRNLRQTLKLVRRALEARGDAAIVGVGDALMLETETAEVDVALFEQLHQAGTSEAFERAAALYQGDFLEGVNLADGRFEDWSMVERVRLRERALDIFTRLLDGLPDAEGTASAIDMALRLLALDPLQEQVHRRLMRLYLARGRRGAALEQYRVCRAILARELGVSPEPETERIHQEIRRRQTRIELPSSASEPPAEPGAPPPSRAVDPLLARPAVAVLPFANLSDDPSQTYFSDGLSEDIITALAGWRCFPVIASSSTRAFRDERHDMRAVADSLDARYVVDGSVRKVGRRMRVTARLIEGEGGRHLWAERFDFDLHDILAVQEEAARKIAAIVEPELERAELRRIVTNHTDDLTAWDHCLRGKSFLHHRTPDGNARARSSFERALGLDPGYSDAFTGLANSHLRDIRVAVSVDREALIAKGLGAARQAVALDPESSMAHLVFAEAHVWSERLDVAIPETELAIELNPSNAAARMALGNRLDLIGKTAEGVAEMERSLQLNPRDPLSPNYMAFLSRAHLTLGEHETACLWANKAVQLRPDQPDLHFRLAICLAHLDRAFEARAALDECERLLPGFLEGRRSWRPYAEASRNENFFAGLQRHGLLN